MNILFVQGRGLFAYKTLSALIEHKIQTAIAKNYDEMIGLLSAYKFDAIVMSNSFDGRLAPEIIRTLPRSAKQIPMMVMFERDEPDLDVINALNAGADDAIQHHMNWAEFSARLTGLVRRAHGHGSSFITSGRLTLNLTCQIATIDGARLVLTRREYAILEALMLRKGRMISKTSLLDILYAGHDEPGIKIIDVFICKIRKKLSAALGNDQTIETIWGRGYVFQDNTRLLEDNQQAA